MVICVTPATSASNVWFAIEQTDKLPQGGTEATPPMLAGERFTVESKWMAVRANGQCRSIHASARLSGIYRVSELEWSTPERPCCRSLTARRTAGRGGCKCSCSPGRCRRCKTNSLGSVLAETRALARSYCCAHEKCRERPGSNRRPCRPGPAFGGRVLAASAPRARPRAERERSLPRGCCGR